MPTPAPLLVGQAAPPFTLVQVTSAVAPAAAFWESWAMVVGSGTTIMIASVGQAGVTAPLVVVFPTMLSAPDTAGSALTAPGLLVAKPAASTFKIPVVGTAIAPVEPCPARRRSV